MKPNTSIGFFDAQFQRQVREADLDLNPFEQTTLPYLRGRVLDYGCGLGNLAVAAARTGCSVLALDASPAAIAHLRRIVREESLQIEATQADLRAYELAGEFDSVVSIGLLMFLDCATALRQLQGLQSHVRSGGVAAINVLVEGTTYRAMFDSMEHCLFSREELYARFRGWEILHSAYQEFPAPMETVKAFATLIARKPDQAERGNAGSAGPIS